MSKGYSLDRSLRASLCPMKLVKPRSRALCPVQEHQVSRTVNIYEGSRCNPLELLYFGSFIPVSRVLPKDIRIDISISWNYIRKNRGGCKVYVAIGSQKALFRPASASKTVFSAGIRADDLQIDFKQISEEIAE